LRALKPRPILIAPLRELGLDSAVIVGVGTSSEPAAVFCPSQVSKLGHFFGNFSHGRIKAQPYVGVVQTSAILEIPSVLHSLRCICLGNVPVCGGIEQREPRRGPRRRPLPRQSLERRRFDGGRSLYHRHGDRRRGSHDDDEEDSLLAEAEPQQGQRQPTDARERLQADRGLTQRVLQKVEPRDRGEADRARAILLTLSGWTSQPDSRPPQLRGRFRRLQCGVAPARDRAGSHGRRPDRLVICFLDAGSLPNTSEASNIPPN